MTLRIKLSHLVVGLVVAALLVGAGYALATTRNRVIHACVNPKTRAVSVPASGKCSRRLRALSWNQQGPRGARGATGVRGTAGARGATGAAGTPATVSIGSVATESPGSPATVTKSGTGSDAILNFGIPQGAPGVNASGTGATAYGEVWMGSASAEIASGSSDNVVNVTGGDGSATVWVDNCVSATPTEPIITVTPDADSADPLANPNNTANVAGAYVTSYSDDNSPGDHIAEFTVETFNPIPTSNTSVDSDFSFTVYC
jgi:hypothetical protein